MIFFLLPTVYDTIAEVQEIGTPFIRNYTKADYRAFLELGSGTGCKGIHVFCQ